MRSTRMDNLARCLDLASVDGMGHQNLLNKRSDVDLLIVDDFLSVGIGPNLASDLFSTLASRGRRPRCSGQYWNSEMVVPTR
ncbi:hypothetical protein [Arthrobacter psychrolactophilus]|nr:hypothetical protein [Arthrobacter psychrolactophilus]